MRSQMISPLAVLAGSLAVLLYLIFSRQAEARQLNPLGMVNLQKNQALHNALLCLRNTSDVSFPANSTLTFKGLFFNATSRDAATSYCSEPVEQIKVQLNCMGLVYKGFLFEDHSSLADVRRTLDVGCNTTTLGTSTTFNSTAHVSKNNANGLAYTSPIIKALIVAACSFLLM